MLCSAWKSSRKSTQPRNTSHAEKLYLSVREGLPIISLDTVYRKLWWLTELGLVTAQGPIQDRTPFNAHLQYHHLFVCTRCGRTRHFYSMYWIGWNCPKPALPISSIELVEIKSICHASSEQSKETDVRMK